MDVADAAEDRRGTAADEPVDRREAVDEAEDRRGTAAVRGVAQISHVVRFESLENVQAEQGQR